MGDFRALPVWRWSLYVIVLSWLGLLGPASGFSRSQPPPDRRLALPLPPAAVMQLGPKKDSYSTDGTGFTEFSPDGKLVAHDSGHGEIVLWDVT